MPVFSRQRGFSLLEMIVAVAILGISLGMLYQAAGGATRSVATTEDYAYAIQIARSLLADNSVVPPGGTAVTGETADGYRWAVFSTPIIKQEQEGEAPPARVHEIVVTVSWGSDVRPREFKLYSVVPVMEVPAREI